MKRIWAVLALTLVAACSSVPTVRQTLPNFQGKPIGFAMDYLGVPDREYQIEGRRVFVWDNSYAHTYARPRANMGFGIGSGGSYGVGMGFPLGGYETETYRQTCEIKLITGADKIVRSYEFDGDENGCAKYAKRIKAQSQPLPPAR